VTFLRHALYCDARLAFAYAIYSMQLVINRLFFKCDATANLRYSYSTVHYSTFEGFSSSTPKRNQFLTTYNYHGQGIYIQL